MLRPNLANNQQQINKQTNKTLDSQLYIFHKTLPSVISSADIRYNPHISPVTVSNALTYAMHFSMESF